MYEYSNFDDWEATDQWRNRESYKEWKADRPVCAWCGEPILEENAYEMPNGDWVCESCIEEYINDKYRKYIG